MRIPALPIKILRLPKPEIITASSGRALIQLATAKAISNTTTITIITPAYTGKDKKVVVNIVDLKKRIRIEVVDSGKGIKKEELKYIWDKYYKIDKSYQRNTKSTGLGLSIVKNICVQNDIKYGVDSKENSGSTFWIELEKI